MNNFYALEMNDLRWNEYVLKSYQYDFYHTNCYHLLQNVGKPILLVATFGNDFIAIPLILREIEGTDYFDCTSVYGYCGPISNLNFNCVTEEMFEYFRLELRLYFQKNKIISVFSRLHPVICGDQLFSNFGIVKSLNETVAIDLKLSPEEQRKQYRKSNKSEINQLKGKKGFMIKEAESDEEIQAFVEVYKETMERVDADPYYFFDYDYFHSFLKNGCYSTKLLLAIHGGQITAGAVFTVTDKIMQYHLAGTKNEYIKDTPMKLILDTARLIGNQLKLEYLHLGGGVGGSDEDSLFRFKAGFSESRFIFRIWQYVVDQEKYEAICKMKFSNRIINSNFFPQYRAI
jgi:hypothetical protein